MQLFSTNRKITCVHAVLESLLRSLGRRGHNVIWDKEHGSLELLVIVIYSDSGTLYECHGPYFNINLSPVNILRTLKNIEAGEDHNHVDFYNKYLEILPACR